MDYHRDAENAKKRPLCFLGGFGGFGGLGGGLGFHVYFGHRCPPSTTASSSVPSAGRRTQPLRFKPRTASRATPIPNCGTWRRPSLPGWWQEEFSRARELRFWPAI